MENPGHGQSFQPHSFAAEQAIIGCVLNDSSKICTVLEHVLPDHFFDRRHRTVFTGLMQCFEGQLRADIVVLAEMLRKNGTLERAGGVEYVTTLRDAVFDGSCLEEYCCMVKEQFLLRCLIAISKQTIEKCRSESADPHKIVDNMCHAVFNEMHSWHRPIYVPVHAVGSDVVRMARNERDIAENAHALRTGITDLDDIFGGFYPGTLTVIAADSLMGKTSLVLNLIYRIGIQMVVPLVLFSPISPAISLGGRLISVAANIKTRTLTSGALPEHNLQTVTEIVSDLRQCQVFFCDDPDLSMLDIRSKSQRLISEHGIAMVLVDGIQPVRTDSPSSRLAGKYYDDLFRVLKELAVTLHLPMVVTYRIPCRQLADAPRKRPVLGNLPDADMIERYADSLLFVHRETEFCDICSVYEDSCTLEHCNYAEISVAKQNSGLCGSVKLAFCAETGRFDNFRGGAS